MKTATKPQFLTVYVVRRADGKEFSRFFTLKEAKSSCSIFNRVTRGIFR